MRESEIEKDPLLKEAKVILDWRLQNNYNWNHPLRNKFWSLLSSNFPRAFQPLGKIDAVAEVPMFQLSKLWLLNVPVQLTCSEASCSQFLGTFTYSCDIESCILSHPWNSDLSNSDYTLIELFLSKVNTDISRSSRLRVKCFPLDCQGVAVLQQISPCDIHIPHFLFFCFVLLTMTLALL